MRIGIVPANGAGQKTMAKTGQLARMRRHFHAYVEAGHQVTYFAGTPDDPPWPHVTVSRARWGLSERSTALLRPLLERKAFQRCDVLRAPSLLGAVTCLVAHRLYGIPFVVSHGAQYETVATIHKRKKQIPKWQWLRKLAFRYAARVLVPNPIDAEEFQRDFPQAKITWIPNWVDPDLFYQQDVRAIRQRPPVVMTVGRLVIEKNLVRLAKVVHELGACLVSVGAGPVTPELARLGVECPGAINWPQIPSWHARAWVYAAPALTEGHPKALLEAMSSGLPCAVSKSIRGVVLHEHTALVFDPEKPDDMGTQIGRLLRDEALAIRLGMNARAESGQYDYRKVLPQEIALLESVV